MKIKEDWLINNQNIFGFQQGINLSLSSIQYEISNQLNGKNINSIADYLGSEIDINKEIQLTKSLSIKKIFDEFLGFENIDSLEQKTVNCYLILSYLQLFLFKEYCENKHISILTFSEYEMQYNTLLNSFLSSNIDTDEQDFIKAEQIFCSNLITELNKPVYNVISPLNEVLDKPCEFKRNLLNSIDKRLKFLEQKEPQQKKHINNENEIFVWFSEYELRQFIDTATRWKISAVYSTQTKQRPFGMFTNSVQYARADFEKFSSQLKKELSNSQNWKVIEMDLQDRFLLMLNQYIKWYKDNETETNKFEPYNPYSLMLSVIESTKQEILKYFPELNKSSKEPQPTGKITKEQLFEYDNKLISKVSIREVFNHFEILTKETNKDNIVYLTEKQLINFIKNTFVENLPKQQEFNGFLYSKKDVRSVFYRFYKKSTLFESKQTGLKQKYFNIMNDSFKGFNSTDFKEFNKTNNKVAT